MNMLLGGSVNMEAPLEQRFPKSFHIGRIPGTTLQMYFHYFMVVYVAMQLVLDADSATGSPDAGIIFAIGIGLTVALVLTTVIHELGHALCARYFDIPVHGVVLLPLGAGVTHHGPTSSGWESFWITFWGPITHVFMLIPLLIIYFNFPYFDDYLSDVYFEYFIAAQIHLQVIVFALNMFVPAYPLDASKIWARLLMKMPCCQMTLTRTAHILIVWLVLAAVGLGVFSYYYQNALTIVYIIFVLYQAYQMFGKSDDELKQMPLFQAVAADGFQLADLGGGQSGGRPGQWSLEARA